MSLGQDRAIADRDGYEDGSVNSDWAVDDGVDLLDREESLTNGEIVNAMTTARGFTVLRELAGYLRGRRDQPDDLAEFLADGSEQMRTRAEMKDLFASYLSGWKRGFAARWKSQVRR